MNLKDVLVVSGSDGLRSLVSFSLGSYWGVVIRQAGDPTSAAARVAERVPQLAIVDANTEGAEGLIRSLNGRGARIIAINDTGVCAAAGAHAVIPPPFKPPNLHAAVEAALS